jgi:hypothetical protein
MTSTRQPSAETIERELASVMRRRKRHATALKEIDLDRDRLIREAIEAKLPRHRIVAVTELSTQRIDQIRRGTRR